MKFLLFLLVLIFSPYGESSEKKRDFTPPHIIIIVIDDLGEIYHVPPIIITIPHRLERCVLE